MEKVLIALFSFLGGVSGAVLTHFFTRRDKYKEFVYERKILTYEEMCGLVSEIRGKLLKLDTMLEGNVSKSLQKILEELDFCGSVLSLYLFCYEKNIFISQRVFTEVLVLVKLCSDEEFRGNPEAFIRAVYKALHNVINVVREEVGVEKLSDEIRREIEKFL
ncbi:hypothetical protein [Aquifex pyrophilus]